MTTTTRRPTTSAALIADLADIPDWQTRGACRLQDAELWFPIGQSNEARAQEEEAKAVCYRCPVMERCGQWALETRQPSGVWGGLSERDRLLIQRRKARRYMPGYMRAWERIITNQRQEFLKLERSGLGVKEIALRLGTNVQTVNRVRASLAQQVPQVVNAA